MIWFWVALWVVLVLAAAAVLGLVVRTLWGKAKLLMREVGEAAERLAPVTDRLQEVAEQRAEPAVAVFDSPTRLRQERYVAARARDRGRESAEQRRGGRHAATAVDRPVGTRSGRMP